MKTLHREWKPGMPLRTQAEVDALRAKIDWLRNLPFDQWPTISAAKIEAGVITANKIIPLP